MYGHTVGSALAMGDVTTPVAMKRADVIDAPFKLQVNGERFAATASFRPSTTQHPSARNSDGL